MQPTIWARLTALGFALGSLAHALGFVLLVVWGIQWKGPTYPAWRHLVMAAVDLSILLVVIAIVCVAWEKWFSARKQDAAVRTAAR